MDEPNDTEIVILKRAKTLAEDPAAGQRKRDRESGRLQAQNDAPEMLALAVQIARNAGEATKDRLTAIKYVCDRAWGTPKAEASEDPAVANKTILDLLERVSADRALIEQEARRQAIEAKPVHPAEIPLETSYELIEADHDDTP